MLAAMLAGCVDPNASVQTAPTALAANASEHGSKHSEPEDNGKLEQCRQTALNLPLSDLQAQGAAAGAATATSQIASIPDPLSSSVTSAFGGGLFIAQILLAAGVGAAVAQANETAMRQNVLNQCLRERGYTGKATL